MEQSWICKEREEFMMYMKLKDGKSKVLTFSYDDGVVQDIRLIDIFDKHGLRGTFNINTGRYLAEDVVREKFHGKMKLSESQKLYVDSGHEVAVHTLNHTFLDKLSSVDIIKEILTDRRNIEIQYKTVARGMAYPYGVYTEEAIESLKQCGICYSRTTVSTENFKFPQNWLTWNPTCHHKNPKLMDFARRFVEENSRYPMDNWLFYVWGHSFEFDHQDNWNVIEEFAEYVGNKEDIWYATNIEIYDYVKAYESLQVSVDETIVHNPSAIDVWVMVEGATYCIKGGTTLYIDS